MCKVFALLLAASDSGEIVRLVPARKSWLLQQRRKREKERKKEKRERKGKKKERENKQRKKKEKEKKRENLFVFIPFQLFYFAYVMCQRKRK